MLLKRNKELIKEWNHLKERVYWYENEKAEGEVSIQKEKDFSDFVKESSMCFLILAKC